MSEFLLCFIPLFVAVDAIGILPLFVSLTEDVEQKKLKQLLTQSVLVASLVAVLFLLVGQRLLEAVQVQVSDFMIAGGILLFSIAIVDIGSFEKKRRVEDHETIGAVPIGVPLIVGPGVLTTILLLSKQHSFVLNVTSILINILIAGVIFYFSRPIFRILGKPGAKTISKLASLLLASIAVMMIRKGIMISFGLGG